MTFLHTNDVHAHLDEWRAGRGTDCSPNTECISGYARIKQKINEIRNSTRDVVVLNAGDEFQVESCLSLQVIVSTGPTEAI